MKMVEYPSYPEPSIIPQLETELEAEDFLAELASTHDWVSVFWDRGWGDSGQPLEVTIIVDGNGQMPKALLTREIYEALLNDCVIRANSLQTFKARKLHDYCCPEDS